MKFCRLFQSSVLFAGLSSAVQASIIVGSFDFAMAESDFDVVTAAYAQPAQSIAFGASDVSYFNEAPGIYADLQVSSSEFVVNSARSILTITVESAPITSPTVDTSPPFIVDGGAYRVFPSSASEPFIESYTPVIGTTTGVQGIQFTDNIASVNSATIRYSVDGSPIYSEPSSIISAVFVAGNELRLGFFAFNLNTIYGGTDLGIDDADGLVLEFDVTVVPEPSNFALIFTALGLVTVLGRRRRG